MRPVLAFALAAALSATVAAQSDKDHAAHHPDAASAPASSSTPKFAPPKAAQMDAQMKSMRDMHDKMMAARTPAERQALMADHMKAMQDGMTMMGQMKGAKPNRAPAGDMPMSPEMMGKRMDMMEMMMQMMMDREAARDPSAK